MDWQAIASHALERMERPTFILDREGRVLAANTSFARLLGGRHRGSGLTWADLFTSAHANTRDALSTAEGPRELRLLSGRAFDTRVWLTLQLMPATRGESATLLAQVMDVAHADAAPQSPVAYQRYVVSASRHSLGMLLATEHARGAHEPPGRTYCYEAIHGSASPCAGCPVFDSADQLPNRRAIAPGAGGQHYRIVDVAPLNDERLEVKTVCLTNAVLSELVQAKVEWIASEGGLSAREHEVLNLLYVGRSTRDIAMLLDISERTVKYHQANVLRKIGADSRVDLVRLLL